MSPSLIAALLWLIAGNVIGMFPSKRGHWPAAYVLIAIGIPIIAWVFWQDGLLIGFIVLIAGASVLRWPLRYLWRWVRGRFA
jgi:hypothetical protein